MSSDFLRSLVRVFSFDVGFANFHDFTIFVELPDRYNSHFSNGFHDAESNFTFYIIYSLHPHYVSFTFYHQINFHVKINVFDIIL